MDHVVYTDAQADELGKILDEMKTMIIRGAAGRKIPYGRVDPGDWLYLIAAARRSSAPLVFIQHNNQKQLVQDTPAWQLHPRLVPLPDEPTIHKQHGNAFEETNLQAELQAQGVSRVLITGLVTQGCVRATCLGALKLGYQVILVSDAHSTYSKDAPDIIEKWNLALHEKGAVLRETRQIDFNL